MKSKFILDRIVHQENYFTNCEICGEELKHAYIIKNLENNSSHIYGHNCAEKVVEKIIEELTQDTIDYNSHEEDLVKHAKIKDNIDKFISLKENKEIYNFLINELKVFPENQFYYNAKVNIELFGGLQPKMLFHIKLSMLTKFTQIGKIDLHVKIVYIKSCYNDFGKSFYFKALTDKNELIKIVASPRSKFLLDISKKLSIKELTQEVGNVSNLIHTIECLNFIVKDPIEIHILGTFDGKKLKRCKLL